VRQRAALSHDGGVDRRRDRRLVEVFGPEPDVAEPDPDRTSDSHHDPISGEDEHALREDWYRANRPPHHGER
jgi:hypothetical protein